MLWEGLELKCGELPGALAIYMSPARRRGGATSLLCRLTQRSDASGTLRHQRHYLHHLGAWWPRVLRWYALRDAESLAWMLPLIAFFFTLYVPKSQATHTCVKTVCSFALNPSQV